MRIKREDTSTVEEKNAQWEDSRHTLEQPTYGGQPSAADKVADAAKKTTFTLSGNVINMWTLAFVILKLCGVITWKWVWVLSPVWVPAVLGAVLMLLGAILFSWTKH